MLLVEAYRTSPSMFSVVTGYLWGEEEEVQEVQEDWVLVDRPGEVLLYASAVAHMVQGRCWGRAGGGEGWAGD